MTNNDEYDEDAALDLIGRELSLFKEIVGTIDSVTVDLHIMCPRCKTRSTSNDKLVTCSNISCSTTFKSKISSVRADLKVTDVGECT